MLPLSKCRAGLLSESQRIKYTIETFTKGIPDARTYLKTLEEIRKKYVCYLINNLFVHMLSGMVNV
jgi:hypothetical protein